MALFLSQAPEIQRFGIMQNTYQTSFYTLLALLAFAANSVLCRLALAEQQIEALNFTLVRLAAGALVLLILVRPDRTELKLLSSSLGAAAGLFVYALAFSLAYLELDAGIGALILFATIQLMMNGIAFFQGQKFSLQTQLGIALAFIGLVILLLPGQSAPDLGSALLMMLAAAGWVGFLFTGRNNKTPLRDVALAFRWSLIFCIPLLWFIDWSAMNNTGIMLAAASGALTSGLGYAIWYKVLPELGMKNAAQVQLLVPVFAILMGILLLQEEVSLLAMLASGLILCGIGLSIRK